MSGHILGYARASTERQSLDHQLDALTAAGCTRTFTDKMSGTRDDRPGLRQLLDHVREGDVVVVVALDRLGRTLPGIIKTIDELQARGVELRSLREGVDFGSPVGRMVAGIFASLAEYERLLINERAAAARAAAKARGKRLGRKPALTPGQVESARSLYASDHSITDIAHTLGVSRATIYRAIDGESRMPVPATGPVAVGIGL
jgi:DNA invertase Pin-like site-specific DNA recombinase